MLSASERPESNDSRKMADTLVINGREHPMPDPASVRGALNALGLASHPVAVELNGRLVRRVDQETIVLKPGDRMEIVSFVGGG